MKTALVHDWLVNIAGAEKVLEAIYELFPGPIHCLVANHKKLEKSFFADLPIHTSFLQSIPFASRIYPSLLPLFPRAIEGFDLSGYECIISSSHAVAKGVLTSAEQLHICYCHTPMRYAWDLYWQYLAGLKGVKRWIAQSVLHRLRSWDALNSQRVDHFIANSHFIKRRIEKIYRREATVIYPPVATERFYLAPHREEYYFVHSRFVSYKRLDLIMQAFSHLPTKKLLIAGDGPERTNLKAMATKNVEFLGYLPDEEIADYLSRAKAYVFAAEEDFGISIVEAQAAGCPVIAYGKGGATETVLPYQTGLLFFEQTVSSLLNAIQEFEKKQGLFDPLFISNHAQQFSSLRFLAQFQKQVLAFQQDFSEQRRARTSSLPVQIM